MLKVMADTKPFEALKTVSPKTQCYIFNRCRTKYRKRYFNHPFSKEQLALLVDEKQFNTTIFKIVTTPALKKSKKSLLKTPISGTLTFDTIFLLGINAVELKEDKVAVKYIEEARKRTDKESLKNRCDFWLYLLTDEKKYLQRLVESPQVNLYTLRARDILKLPYPETITPKLGVHLVKYIDPYSPIDWENIKLDMKAHPETIEVLADNYRSIYTEGIYSYLKEKGSNYQKQYFPMPILAQIS